MPWNVDDLGWHMGWMMTWGSIVWTLVILGLIWAFLRGGAPRTSERDSPETILKRRYAQGELDREEYERRLTDLRR
jgi:putative membrane protein